MSVLGSSDFVAAWTARMQAAADVHPAIGFDGRAALPVWLNESAREQAERVFLVLDGTPEETRDMAMGERIIRDAGMAFLEAWMLTMGGVRHRRRVVGAGHRDGGGRRLSRAPE